MTWSRDPWVDARVKNSRAHPLVWQPAAAGGGVILDHKKMYNIGSPGRDGGDVCILKLDNWEFYYNMEFVQERGSF